MTTPITLGTEFLINTYTVGSQSNPSITSLADGGFVVTWESGADGSGFGVYGQRYDANGAIVGGEFQVNTYTPRDQFNPSVTGLTDGGFVITWESDRQDGSEWGIYGQRYDAAGAIMGVEFQINSFNFISQRVPTVTSLADGGFVVTWASERQDGSGFGVYGQRYDANGAIVGGEFQVNTFTTSSQDAPSVTSLADGGFVVTWMSTLGQDGSGVGIYGQRYDADGAIVGGEFQINTYTSDDQRAPSVTSLADGGFVVTWESNGQDGSFYGVYGQRYDDNGAMAGAEFQINTTTASTQLDVSVTSLADGGYVVTWESEQDGSGLSVHGQRYDATGAIVGVEFQINTYTAHNQKNPSVTALADGGFVVTWESTGQDDPFSGGIYGQQYMAQLFGTAGDDSITDTVGSNWIDGQGGDDILNGGAGKDTILGGSGNDVLKGGGGNDVLKGGGGKDVLKGAKHKDILKGGNGNDELFGGGGNDLLDGGGGKDLLDGGGGNDKMTGGAGADTFVFSLGNDVIIDFNAVNNREKIDLSDVASIKHFKDLKNNHLSDVDDNLVIDDQDGNTLTLNGLSISDLGKGDFIF